MTKHLEAPSGYRMHSYSDIGIAIPAPNDWVVWGHQMIDNPENRVYCIAEQCILQPDNLLGYRSGMSVGTFQNIYPRAQSSSSLFARDIAVRAPGLDARPSSDVDEYISGPLITFMRAFEFDGDTEDGEPLSYCVAGISHEAADTAYAMFFQAPKEQWDTYGKIGRTMIEGVELLEYTS